MLYDAAGEVPNPVLKGPTFGPNIVFSLFMLFPNREGDVPNDKPVPKTNKLVLSYY